MITTMLLDYPPHLVAGQEVEFVGWLPGDCLEVRDADGTTWQVDASHVSADFYRKSKGGRPTLSDEPNVKVEIVMPASLRDKLDRLAPNENRSAWIRQAIERAAESDKEHEVFTVEKFKRGSWAGHITRPTLDEAIAACEYYDNLHPGRVVKNGEVVWTDENVPPTPRQAVADKDGQLVGYQPK